MGKKFNLNPDKKWYLKSDLGFAGRGNRILELNGKSKFEANQEVIIEEYLERIIDFSIALLENGKILIYQNIVNPRGQYVETKINFNNCSDIKSFLKSFAIDSQEINAFAETFSKIIHYYQNLVNEKILLGSFDFFIFMQNNKLFIHPCCEFNPRWTMGRVSWEIAKKFNFQNLGHFSSCFSPVNLDGYHQLSPISAKVKFQVKWH